MRTIGGRLLAASLDDGVLVEPHGQEKLKSANARPALPISPNFGIIKTCRLSPPILAQTPLFGPTIRGLEPIAAKVLAAGAAGLRRRARALWLARRAGRGLAGESCARADARRRDLLQCQSPHQPDECVRGGMQAVRVRPQEGRSCRIHHGAGRGVGDGGVGLLRGGHGVSHCRRSASRSAARVFSRPGERTEGALPQGAHQGLHDG